MDGVKVLISGAMLSHENGVAASMVGVVWTESSNGSVRLSDCNATLIVGGGEL